MHYRSCCVNIRMDVPMQFTVVCSQNVTFHACSMPIRPCVCVKVSYFCLHPVPFFVNIHEISPNRSLISGVYRIPIKCSLIQRVACLYDIQLLYFHFFFTILIFFQVIIQIFNNHMVYLQDFCILYICKIKILLQCSKL